MLALNFLPWREKKRERDQQALLAALLCFFGFILGSLAFFHVYFVYQRNEQIARNKLLHHEITRLEPSLRELHRLLERRKALIAQRTQVHQMQQRKTVVIHVLDELIRVLPTRVYLTELKQQGEGLLLWGYAKSGAALADFMRNIEKNRWIRHPVLREMKASDTSHGFKLHCELASKELTDAI